MYLLTLVVVTNVWSDLRSCGHNCELVRPLSQISRSCLCRKRKEHEEDLYEHDCKFSKSSNQNEDGNSMKFLIQKWAKNQVVKANVVQEDSEYEVNYHYKFLIIY